MTHRPALIAALALVCLAALVAPGLARPPPQDVCGVCGDDLERAAAEHGLQASVESSSVTLAVDEEGTGTWTARVRLDPASADALAANETLRWAVLRDAARYGEVGPEGARNLTATVSGDTLQVRATLPDAGYRGVGGVLVVDQYDWAGDLADTYRLDADRLTVRGPNGSVVTRTPARATAGEGAVSWTEADADAGGVTSDWLPRDGRVTFADDDGVRATVATRLALWQDAAPYVLPDALRLAAGPSLVLAVGVLGVSRLTRPLADTWDDRSARLLAVVSAGGGVLLALLAAFGTASWGAQYLFAGIAVVAVQVAALLSTRRVLEAHDRRSVAVWTASVVLAGWVALTGIAWLHPWGTPGLPVLSFAQTTPVLLFFPLGAAGTDATRWTALVVAAVAVACAVIGLTVAPVSGPAAYSVLAGLPWAVCTVAVGALLFLAGRHTADERGDGTS